MSTVNREELAWAAGFFDGEGSTILTNGYGRMSISQVDRRPLDRFRNAILGIGQVYGPYDHGKNQPIHRWATNGFQNVQAAAIMLWPFLSGPKREQARPVLETMKWAKPVHLAEGDFVCRRGHVGIQYKSKAQQCRMCMRVTDAKRRNGLTPAWISAWEVEGGVPYTGWLWAQVVQSQGHAVDV